MSVKVTLKKPYHLLKSFFRRRGTKFSDIISIGCVGLDNECSIENPSQTVAPNSIIRTVSSYRIKHMSKQSIDTTVGTIDMRWDRFFHILQ